MIVMERSCICSRTRKNQLKPEDYIDSDWMIPAPAQGAMLVVAMANDEYSRHYTNSMILILKYAHIERQFLKTLEGGCTAPIGALAVL
jgi:hydroxymethylbilane synthase